MARKISTKLNVLPKSKKPGTIPKPKVKPIAGDQFSQRAMRSQAGINVPGVKTQ